MNDATFHALLRDFLMGDGTSETLAFREEYWVFQLNDDEIGISITTGEQGEPTVGRFFCLVAELECPEDINDYSGPLLNMNNELPFAKVYVPQGTSVIGVCCDFPISNDLNTQVLQAWAELLVQALYQVREQIFPEEIQNITTEQPPGAG